MLELALGNLYPAPELVEAILAPKSEATAILDLGTERKRLWYQL